MPRNLKLIRLHLKPSMMKISKKNPNDKESEYAQEEPVFKKFFTSLNRNSCDKCDAVFDKHVKLYYHKNRKGYINNSKYTCEQT